MVNSIEKRVCDLRDRAVAYYTGETVGAHQAAEASHIKHEIQSIVAAVSLLTIRHTTHYADSRGPLIELRKAFTGGLFESGQRESVTHDSPIIQGLWLTSSALAEWVRERFELSHRYF